MSVFVLCRSLQGLYFVAKEFAQTYYMDKINIQLYLFVSFVLTTEKKLTERLFFFFFLLCAFYSMNNLFIYLVFNDYLVSSCLCGSFPK